MDDDNQTKSIPATDNASTENENKEEDTQSKITLLNEEISKLRKECETKDATISTLNESLANLRASISDSQKNFETRLKQSQLDAIRKENIYVMKLTLKEQEEQEHLSRIDALNQNRVPSSTQLANYLLDPALNYLFAKMRQEVDQAKQRVEEMQNEMSAWKFSADSNTGKQLMAKCRLLHQENEELGKMISSGKIAKLESGLALHKNFSEQLKKSQGEFEEVLMEMEEDIEGFQNTIFYLQQQLKESHEKSASLEKELASFKAKMVDEKGELEHQELDVKESEAMQLN